MVRTGKRRRRRQGDLKTRRKEGGRREKGQLGFVPSSIRSPSNERWDKQRKEGEEVLTRPAESCGEGGSSNESGGEHREGEEEGREEKGGVDVGGEKSDYSPISCLSIRPFQRITGSKKKHYKTVLLYDFVCLPLTLTFSSLSPQKTHLPHSAS